MLIVIFGESCTGKSTLAETLKVPLGAKVYTGKDYKRLAKNEDLAKQAFRQLLEAAVAGENCIWVLSEKEDLALVPEGAVRVRMTAELALIQQRFAARMGGKLPEPVAGMLARKHGMFDGEACDFHADAGQVDVEALCAGILKQGKR